MLSPEQVYWQLGFSFPWVSGRPMDGRGTNSVTSVMMLSARTFIVASDFMCLSEDGRQKRSASL